MILESVENGPLIWPTIEENGVTRTKKYVELFVAEKIQADCDMKATNIILQGLPADIYSLVKSSLVLPRIIWDRVQLLMQVQQVKGEKVKVILSTGYKSNATSSGGNNASGQAMVVKCYNCQGEGHMARQCTQPKGPRNTTWYKDKAMLVEAQEAGQIFDEEQLVFLADPGVPDGQAVQCQSFQTMMLFRLRIVILMILTVMISQMKKQFLKAIFQLWF
ncbi:putative ribonuclease H-like domain-containing protein [Tanacetum coccineum]